MTTPEQFSLPPPGDCRATVISDHSLNGDGLRNSIPLLWITTVSADNSSFACRASTVTGCSNELPPTYFFALIELDQTSTLPESVKLVPDMRIISSPGHVGLDCATSGVFSYQFVGDLN